MPQFDRSAIIQAIQEILKTHLEPPFTGELNENTSLIDDLKVDSLDAVSLLLAVEEKFEIDISDEEAAGLLDLKSVVACIEAKLKGKEQQAKAEQPSFLSHVDQTSPSTSA